jgi:hypothetical protein
MPPRKRSFADVVRAAEETLRSNRVEHVFVGGLAVIVYGEVRTTRDVDVFARLSPEKIPALVAEFRRRGFLASEDDLLAAYRERGHSSIEDTRSPLRIDLVVRDADSPDPVFRHHVLVRWRGMALPVATPEHTIVMKLKFGSDQDVEDAFGILVEHRETLDRAEMADFARRQGVSPALEGLVERARTAGASGRVRGPTQARGARRRGASTQVPSRRLRGRQKSRGRSGRGS